MPKTKPNQAKPKPNQTLTMQTLRKAMLICKPNFGYKFQTLNEWLNQFPNKGPSIPFYLFLLSDYPSLSIPDYNGEFITIAFRYVWSFGDEELIEMFSRALVDDLKDCYDAALTGDEASEQYKQWKTYEFYSALMRAFGPQPCDLPAAKSLRNIFYDDVEVGFDDSIASYFPASTFAQSDVGVDYVLKIGEVLDVVKVRAALELTPAAEAARTSSPVRFDMDLFKTMRDDFFRSFYTEESEDSLNDAVAEDEDSDYFPPNLEEDDDEVESVEDDDDIEIVEEIPAKRKSSDDDGACPSTSPKRRKSAESFAEFVDGLGKVYDAIKPDVAELIDECVSEPFEERKKPLKELYYPESAAYAFDMIGSQRDPRVKASMRKIYEDRLIAEKKMRIEYDLLIVNEQPSEENDIFNFFDPETLEFIQE